MRAIDKKIVANELKDRDELIHELLDWKEEHQKWHKTHPYKQR